MWFYKWFFRNTTPDPFKNVIHRLDGPHSEQDGGESYFIDFGTAPPEAFLDLIYHVCINDVLTADTREEGLSSGYIGLLAMGTGEIKFRFVRIKMLEVD